ncbi:ABC transporter ATP-binding protein/permease [Bacteroides fragilis]|uniref:ABC transporter ATP-binding protein n=1 Tax=Bacteroides TaxID=816 RepID=UPI0020307C6D|nr:ABC transporter ATP-binding protein [Bacteroides fragilis]MCE8588940.1 ABC transporter ATP-binding protein/permease [Bacteroides fragilis]MCE8592970.1 ABC transporter ATP-binding protein/permease [Bacteroides fragilis]MCE8657599.1 ABC transporter ATP-binding protein/permease [Bacteroides fragilis]MCE8660304.1 ABC transporter ATP-binding protein/permease [Bacteroides fragilis]MCM0265277.1 ABC transporter ATP-binding protein [Bacteroides fragilis]
MRTALCISWLWGTSNGIRSHIVLSSISGMGYVCASLAFVWVSKRLVDIATFKAGGGLWSYAALMGCCIVVQLFCSAIDSRIDLLNSVRLKNTLRHRLFARIMESPLTDKKQLHTGEMLNRMEEDTRIVTDVLCTALPSVIGIVVQLVAAFCFLAVLNLSLTWMLVGIMPVALLLSKIYLRRIRHFTGEIRSTEEHIQSYVQEGLQHRTLIRCLEHIPHTTTALSGMQTTLYQQVMRRTNFTLFSRTVVQAGFAIGYATTFLWSIQGLFSGTVTFGMMTAFLQLVAQVQRPVVELSRYIPSFLQSVTSVERLEELDALPPEKQGKPILLPGSVGVRLEEVSFSYPDGSHKVINNFTYNFTPGSFTALVGETGAGKSTLIRLILALFTPEKGYITLYNDTEEVAASTLSRCNLVYVPQGNTLLSGTIRENLLLGNPHATEAELKEVLYAAVAEFVFDLKDRFDTHLGEGGAGLSEGQAQRLAIARGLLRPGGILLLDEPTSSLDGKTERTLLKRLATRMTGKTVILITHRNQAASSYAATITIERNQ